MTLRWRTMSESERERAYSPSSCLVDGDYRPFVAAYRDRSRTAWSQLEAAPNVRTTVVRYGPADPHRIDVAVPLPTATVTADDAVTNAGAAPMLVFLHGGYWQELSAADSRFAAADAVDRGWGFAAVDYTLAPEADLDAIVDECRTAVGALRHEAPNFGVDPERLVVAGSSAGAHLAAMVAMDDVGGDADHRPAGVVLVSGIFALEPLIGTSINEALGLDVDAARRNSPLLAPEAVLARLPATVIAYGDNETEEFKAQSLAFAERLTDVGRPVATLEVPGRNHFDVILDLAAADTTLAAATASLVDGSGGGGADV